MKDEKNFAGMSEAQIAAKIDEILADEVLSYPAADIFINAPLALVQLAMEVKLHTLQDVLGVERTNFKKLREGVPNA